MFDWLFQPFPLEKGIHRKVKSALWGGIVVFSVLFLSACDDKKSLQELDALVYETAKPLSDFSLNDQQGELVTKKQFLDQWNLVFLGYTSCPDICPMTLAKLNNVYKNLQANYPLQVWFISVDPKRDIAQKRKEYIDYFNPDFLKILATCIEEGR